jgi:hypothetical protein
VLTAPLSSVDPKAKANRSQVSRSEGAEAGLLPVQGPPVCKCNKQKYLHFEKENFQGVSVCDPRVRVFEDVSRISDTLKDTVKELGICWTVPDKSNPRRALMLQPDDSYTRTLGFDVQAFTTITLPEKTIPSQLIPVYERLLLFCIQVAHPYMMNGGVTPFFSINYISYSVMNTIITGRDRAGLLRDGQVRLIEAWIQGSIDELQAKMAKGVMASEVLRILEQMRLGILDFFGKIRSEGLEARILRYLEEDGCNMDVVNGVQKATNEYHESWDKFYLDEEDVTGI